MFFIDAAQSHDAHNFNHRRRASVSCGPSWHFSVFTKTMAAAPRAVAQNCTRVKIIDLVFCCLRSSLRIFRGDRVGCSSRGKRTVLVRLDVGLVGEEGVSEGAGCVRQDGGEMRVGARSVILLSSTGAPNIEKLCGEKHR